MRGVRGEVSGIEGGFDCETAALEDMPFDTVSKSRTVRMQASTQRVFSNRVYTTLKTAVSRRAGYANR